jgi:hypothetical protein
MIEVVSITDVSRVHGFETGTAHLAAQSASASSGAALPTGFSRTSCRWSHGNGEVRTCVQPRIVIYPSAGNSAPRENAQMMIYTTTHAGFTSTRRSDGHTQPRYTHAVWSEDPEGKWHCQAYTSRLELAQYQQRSYAKFHRQAVIAPVVAEFREVKRKGPVDFPGETFKRCGIEFKIPAEWTASDGPPSPHSRVGTYKRWTIYLRCSGKVFSAVVYPSEQPDNWNTRHYVANGGLDSRVEKAKEIINGLPPLHS